MSLLALPPELLRHITLFTSPRSFEALLLSCSTLYHAGKGFLPRHNALDRRFRHFHCDEDMPGSNQLLDAIHADPVISEYIETADISASFCIDAEYCRCDPNILNVLWNAMPILAQQYAGPMITADPPHGYCSGSGLTATMQILTLLRNARELALGPIFLPRLDEDRRRWENILSVLSNIKEVDLSRSAAGNCMLPNLERLVICNPEPLLMSRIMTSFAPVLASLLALPSVTHLYVSRCVLQVPPQEFLSSSTYLSSPVSGAPPERLASRLHRGGASNLQELTLQASCIDAQDLGRILSHCPFLRTFHYRHASIGVDRRHSWDANACVRAIVEHSAEVLQDLSITMHSFDGHIKGGLRSFKALGRLKNLELEVQFFFGPEVNTAYTAGLQPREYREHAYKVHWNGSLLPNVAQLLPDSTENVHLIAGASREDVLILKSLFEDFTVAGSLPNLASVQVTRSMAACEELWPDVRHADSAWKSVREVVLAAGGEYAELDSVMPRWMPAEDDYDRESTVEVDTEDESDGGLDLVDTDI